MTPGEKIYHMALRAYPEPYRSECGAEVAETALELRGGKWSPFETFGLIKGGMRTRARAGLSGEGSSVWISGLRLGVFFFVLDGLAVNLMSISGGGPPFLPNTPWFVYVMFGLSVGVVAAMTFTTGRVLAAAQTLMWVAGGFLTHTEWMAAGAPYPYRLLLADILVLGAIWVVALRSDGRRATSPPAALLLLVVWCGVLSFDPGYLYGGIPFQSLGQVYALIAVGLAGIFTTRIDPRPIAGALIWLGLSAVHTGLLKSYEFVAIDFVALLVVTAVAGGLFGLALRSGRRALTRI